MISAAELLDLPFDEDDNIRFFPATEEWATVADMTQEDRDAFLSSGQKKLI